MSIRKYAGNRATQLASLAAFALMLASGAAQALDKFDIPAQPLSRALTLFAAQSGYDIIADSALTRTKSSHAVSNTTDPDTALSRVLEGTGLTYQRNDGSFMIMPKTVLMPRAQMPMQVAMNIAPLETVTVTSSKIGGDVQNIPIAISAFSQEQLKATQTVGGPDLVKQVPNFNFSKTNFTGYNIQIRGIGTQAISVTTDPAVAVAFNDVPFLRNHFFEQEFFDVGQVQVLRGPQGTIYGRNATAGVVNIISARPSDQFEAMVSGDVGNYSERRIEAMLNIPVTDDRLDLRFAGEWTKRAGYTFNETTDERVDGRDLWSGRMTVGFKPAQNLQTYLIWEHFSEDDDRERSTKQLCHDDPGPSTVGPFTQSFDTPEGHISAGDFINGLDRSASGALSQGCTMASLYSPASFETPNGAALPIVYATQFGGASPLIKGENPYASETQSTNLRVIQSTLKPFYKAKNDIIEFTAEYNVTPALTITSETGYNHDFLASEEDFNRFNSTPGIFFKSADEPNPGGFGSGAFGVGFTPGGLMCDPQIGCADRFVGEDLSQEHAWQISQELRLASNFKGPFNFTVGANYLHYETLEDYYVFLNLLPLETRFLDGLGGFSPTQYIEATANGLCLGLPEPQTFPPLGQSIPLFNCPYTDGSPLTPGFNGQGHNYFRNTNPYVLSSYAGFGEANYEVLDDLKLIGGLRWTDDQKHFVEIPSELLNDGWGYPISGVVNQEWKQVTGRAVINWTPKLDFTDQTLVYASFSRGYKAGGANPPAPDAFASHLVGSSAAHPLTFAPEFVNAYEAGTKDTLLDGTVTFNGDVFYYDYKGYQISEIVDRTSINLNFDANVRGAEIETTWEPLPGLRFNFAGGWEDSKLAKGSQAIDLIDRTAGHPGWVVVKPSIFSTSNCILPENVVAELVEAAIIDSGGSTGDNFFSGGKYISAVQDGFACESAYNFHIDPVVEERLTSIVPPTGFDPTTAPNNGEGFNKDLTNNQLPNAPPFTVSVGGQYTMPLSPDWAGTLRSDFYWQSNSFARVENDRPYDQIKGYTNVNLTLIFTNQNGWQAMLYDKNVFNTTAITGTFLNSDDTGLTTNIFVTDPRLIGIRVTKNW